MESDVDLRERALRGYPDAMAALADAGEDLGFLTPEQRAYGWCQTFHPRLAEGMGVCHDTLTYRLLTSLKLGLPVTVDDPLTAGCALDALGCPDREVAARAREALRELPPDLIDGLCLRTLSPFCPPPTREAWLELGHLPSLPHRRQIYLIRMNMIDQAEELDPAGEHLVTGALELRPAWRLALAALLRERGRGHLVPRMLGIARENVQLDGPMLDEMVRQNQLEGLWTLAPFASVERAREIILALDRRGFAAGQAFQRAVELARSPHEPQPVFRTEGKFLGWGGRRLVLRLDTRLHALDWRDGTSLWSYPGKSKSAVVSPDGLWTAVQQARQVRVLGPEGRPIRELSGTDFDFSPCSQFVTCRVGRYRIRQLWQLSPLVLLANHWWHNFSWWGNGQAIASDPDQLHFYDLRTGVTTDEPTPSSRGWDWCRSSRGSRWMGRVGGSSTLVVESDGTRHTFAGKGRFLEDERVVLGNSSLWDGRLLRKLSLPDPPWLPGPVDPIGGRTIVNQLNSTGFLRLGDTVPYRQLPARLVAQHPHEPYYVTEHANQLQVWHVPPESPLQPSMLDDGAAAVEPPLRPLALFLLHRRFQHDVSLEENLPLSPVHQIELGD